MPAIFTLIQERGGIARDEMLRAFNMGIGMTIVCAATDAKRVLGQLAAGGESGAVVIGEITTGSGVCY